MRNGRTAAGRPETGAATPGLAVRMTGIHKTYGRTRAVAGLDLSIRSGETVALLGRNGAGKSTTIAMLLGLLTPDEGSVTLFDLPSEQAVRAGLVSAMLQEGGLIPRITVRELIGFVRGTFPAPMPLAEILRVAQLTELAGKRVDKLSGGQAQRVRFALALAGNPRLLVLDEPTAALDVESRRELWTAMRSYAAEGNTVLFSTHYLEEADQNAERIIVIDGGKVVADGSSARLKQAAAGRMVSFDLGDASPWTVERLGSLPGVVTAEIRGLRAYLRTTDSDRTLAALGPVPQLEITSAGLEEAFVELTRSR